MYGLAMVAVLAVAMLLYGSNIGLLCQVDANLSNLGDHHHHHKQYTTITASGAQNTACLLLLSGFGSI